MKILRNLILCAIILMVITFLYIPKDGYVAPTDIVAKSQDLDQIPAVSACAAAYILPLMSMIVAAVVSKTVVCDSCGEFGVSVVYYEEKGGVNMKYFSKGQGIVEYALVLVLVVIVIIGILTLIGPAIGNIFSQIVNAL